MQLQEMGSCRLDTPNSRQKSSQNGPITSLQRIHHERRPRGDIRHRRTAHNPHPPSIDTRLSPPQPNPPQNHNWRSPHNLPLHIRRHQPPGTHDIRNTGQDVHSADGAENCREVLCVDWGEGTRIWPARFDARCVRCCCDADVGKGGGQIARAGEMGVPAGVET